MKNLLTPAHMFAVAVLLACWGARAQSLGSPAAEAWLGRPLDMTVPARVAAADAGDACVRADVFFGEQRVDAGRVRTTVTGTGEQRSVRVETTALVDEPVVTVSLRAGCRGSITRNYTLLPVMPSETMVAGLVARQQALAFGAPAPGTPPRLARATTSAAPVAARNRAPRPDATTLARAQAPRARVLRDETPRAAARLRLEPVEMRQQAVLRVSASLSDPSGDAASRATAALLWRAINADPQELLRTTAMLQKLEGDLAQLRQATGQTRADMAALGRSLDDTRPWYASAPLVQGLLLLVLAMAGAAALSGYRSRRLSAGPWYAARDGAVPQTVPSRAQAVPAQPVAAARTQASPDAAPTGREPAAQRRQASGVLRVETLAATFEEAEFLSSLGLAADAMDVLKAYVQDSANPSPLAFFELMRLCDQAGDATAVAAVRRRYARAFRTEAPRLQQVTASTGLESLADLSARIAAAWGTPQVPDLIEEALFAAPAPGAPLTLQAGRDLLCLHALALALAAEDTARPGLPADQAHPLAPWAHAEDAGSAQAAVQAAGDAQGGHDFALDVDLDARHMPLPEDRTHPDVAPLLEGVQAAARETAAREAARRRQEEEDAFSAAVASERAPAGRY